MSVRTVRVLLFLLGGGCAPETSTQVSPSPSSAAPKRAANEPVVDDADTTPPAAVEASPDDAILKAILTDDRFAMYLHPDVAGRVPVVVSGKARPPTVSLELHGAAVETKPPENLAPEQAFVDIGTWSVEEDRASVELAYEIEGVAASFDLERDGAGRWIVTAARVVER